MKIRVLMPISVYPRLYALQGVSVVLFLLKGMLAAQTLTTLRLSLKVENTAESTLLIATEKGSDTPVTLRIDWKTGSETPSDFKNQAATKRIVTSSYLLGETKITRTILVSAESDAIFLHVHANQPGPVNFTARFISENPGKIEDRRQLVLSGEKIHAHTWIIPYESDVSDDGKATITLAGEGEALIVLNLTADPEKHPISTTLTRLGQKYDPSHIPASPHLIWAGVEQEMKE